MVKREYMGAVAGGPKDRRWTLGVAVFLAVAAGTVTPATTDGSTLPPTDAVASMSPSDADYRRMEREIVEELNVARTNPRAYANTIAAILPYFDGDLLRRPGMLPRQTVEGIAPAQQAIVVLSKQKPIGALTVNDGLALAARDHVIDQLRSGQTGHRCSDGTEPDARVDRYGRWDVSYSENIAYGVFSKGADVVLSLIVDDGVPDRGHRRNIFDPSVTVVGVACGPHPRFGSTCVIEHAGLFTKN